MYLSDNNIITFIYCIYKKMFYSSCKKPELQVPWKSVSESFSEALYVCDKVCFARKTQRFTQTVTVHVDGLGRVAGQHGDFFGREIDAQKACQVLFTLCQVGVAFRQVGKKFVGLFVDGIKSRAVVLVRGLVLAYERIDGFYVAYQFGVFHSIAFAHLFLYLVEQLVATLQEYGKVHRLFLVGCQSLLHVFQFGFLLLHFQFGYFVLRLFDAVLGVEQLDFLFAFVMQEQQCADDGKQNAGDEKGDDVAA